LAGGGVTGSSAAGTVEEVAEAAAETVDEVAATDEVGVAGDEGVPGWTPEAGGASFESAEPLSEMWVILLTKRVVSLIVVPGA
jgi:hypothetical protein